MGFLFISCMEDIYHGETVRAKIDVSRWATRSAIGIYACVASQHENHI